jgi:hypothetical protein
MSEVQANYANEAGKAGRADFALRADQADKSRTAEQATYAMVSREAERLNVAGNFAYIDLTNHYLILYIEGTGPSQGIIFDLANHTMLNVEQISASDGNSFAQEVKLTEELGSSQHALSGLGGLKLQDKIDLLEERIIQLETQLSTFI